MRVKIGDQWYNSEKQPICVQLSETEQQQIADMDRTVATKGKYASFPEGWPWSHDERLKWMSDGNDVG